MRHTVSDGSGRYDPLDIASLQLWQQGQQEDNRQQIRRLLVNLPLAVEEELNSSVPTKCSTSSSWAEAYVISFLCIYM